MGIVGRLRDLPIRRKLRGITVVSAGVSLFLACAAFVAYDVVAFRRQLVQQAATEAEIVARQAAAPLVFADPEGAQTTLDSLRADPQVAYAAILAADGKPFSTYSRDGAREPLARQAPVGGIGHVFSSGRLLLHRPVEYDGGTIGVVVIESDLTVLTSRLRRYALIALGVLLVSALVAHWTASRLQRAITGPIQHLAATADAVSQQRDYRVRAVTQSRDELGQLVHAFNHMLDQIETRDMALQESEEKYRLLFDANPTPMWVYDPSSLAFLAVNQSAVSQYGYSRREFAAMTLRDIRPSEDVPVLLERVAGQGSGETSDGLWKHRRKDGSLVDVEIESSAIPFGGVAARLVMATDVSEKKRLESQLIQSQKMEAVGRLAGGVAHDFNNLLGVITGYSDLLRRNLAPNDTAHARVEQIQKAAERAAALTRQLLAFSRKEVVQPRLLDLNEVVADIEKMLVRLIGEDIRLTTKLDKDLGRVRADRGQIDQVILNLAVNARDAMPSGGSLWIETSNTTLDALYLRTHADARPGRYVLVTVSDTGHGMDAETMARIFEPFFTTKPEGRGTGLGLSTVFGIVKQAGGHVNVYSEPGKGTTFRVYLPRVASQDAADQAAAVVTPAPRGSETVLLVEDAEALRPMIQEILEAAGYAVIGSSDPEEAILRAGSWEGPLDLVLTDVIMPRMNGPDLVRAVKPAWPGVRALFMSGYTNDAIGRQGVLGPGIHFIQKPFTSDALLSSVRAALDEDHPD